MDLLFFDYQDKVVRLGQEAIGLADQVNPISEFPLVFLARFPGDERADLLVGYMSDAEYSLEKKKSTVIRHYPLHWQGLDSLVNHWQKSFQYGSWLLTVDVPLVADHDNDGYDSLIVFRPISGQWFLFPNQSIDGPSLPENESPLPIIGRFLPDSSLSIGKTIKVPPASHAHWLWWQRKTGQIWTPPLNQVEFPLFMVPSRLTGLNKQLGQYFHIDASGAAIGRCIDGAPLGSLF